MTSTASKSGLYVPPARRGTAPSSSATTTSYHTSNLASASSATQDGPGPSRPSVSSQSAYRPPGQRQSDDTPAYRPPWTSSAPTTVPERTQLRQRSPPPAWPRERERDNRPYNYDREDRARGGQSYGGTRNSHPRDARANHPASAGSPSRPTSSSPTLYVFGDSFTGPLKLLKKDCCRIQPYKGASAKGLNNPHSLKQVAKELLPAVNSWLAPPPYVYTPSTGRYALFIFGNVDLQINYLWQLQNKRISAASFPPGAKLPHLASESPPDDSSATDIETTVLASATETSVSGPALGPELFVEGIIKAYTAFLEREIVNGPIGKRVRERSITPARRPEAVHKVLIAAALPPLVEDATLPRIPEKYVERLEEDHQKQHQEMERGRSKDGPPPKLNLLPRSGSAIDPTEVGLSTLQLSDDPPSASSADSSWAPSSTPPSSPPSSGTGDVPVAFSAPAQVPSKTSIEDLLHYDPPLCTLPVRIEMTKRYNALLRAFCEQHSDVLGFVDIAPAMLDVDALTPSEEKEPAGTLPAGAVSRRTWACPVDESNIHPLWEPTLPLWLKALKEQGVQTDAFGISQDAEATFAAYELDKKRRVEASGRQEWGARKLRDEE